MINMIINAAIRGATAGAAATWVNQKMQPTRTTRSWNDQIGNVTLTLAQLTRDSRTSYQLFAVAGGAGCRWARTGCTPQALAAIQSWQQYLHNGGTVEAWVRQSLPHQGPRELR